MSMPGDPTDGAAQRGSERYGQNRAERGPAYRPNVGYGASPGQPRNGFGIAALVLGILAVLLFWTVIGGLVFGVLALILGILGRGRAKRGQATNGGLSLAGIVLGILGLLITIGVVALGMSLFNSPAGQNYQQCLQQAGGDAARIQQCVNDFGRRIGG